MALASGCVQQADNLRPDSDLVVISVVGSNDIHGHFSPTGDRGGLTTFSGYVAALRERRAADGGVLLVDGGDMWQGTLESNLNEGAFMVEAFNRLGYAAAAIGNHEFDFGPVGPATVAESPSDDPRGNLKKRAAEASFPLLAANLVDESTGELVKWDNVQPAVMIEIAGVKVGIIGLLTGQTLVTTIPANVNGLRIAPLAESIVREATALRAAGASLVVVTAHAGGRCAETGNPQDLSSCDLSSEILSVAEALPRGLVDHIVGGHEDYAIAHFVNGTAITVGRAFTRSFGRADFWIDRGSGAVRGALVHRPQPICEFVTRADKRCDWSGAGSPATIRASYESRPVVPLASIREIADRAEALAAERKTQPLGIVLETPFSLDGNPESALGNLVTDVLLDSLDADVALHNVFGGLRADLPAGALNYGSVFQMFPFDNRVVILDLSGAELRQVIARQAGVSRRAGFSGMRVDVACDEDRLRVTMTLPSGRAIEDAERVRVAVNDFLATGGDGILTPIMPPAGFGYSADPRFIRDVIADWLRNRGGSLNAADYDSSSNPRWNLPAVLPASCAL